MGAADTSRKLRSQQWFDNPDNPGMTALYMERYLNYGLTRKELQSGKPIIGFQRPLPARLSRPGQPRRSCSDQLVVVRFLPPGVPDAVVTGA